MSRPNHAAGCESDEIGQKMCLGDAVGASDLQMLDAPLFQKRIPGFCADAQYLTHLVDVQHIRVISEHYTVRITGIQSFFTQTDFPFLGSYSPDPMPDCISGLFQFAPYTPLLLSSIVICSVAVRNISSSSFNEISFSIDILSKGSLKFAGFVAQRVSFRKFVNENSEKVRYLYAV